MAPLVTATAYAAYGFIDTARDALSRAARGPSWDAAVEQRLFVEALLDVFEGDRSQAMTKAETLQRLPLPPNVGFRMRRKISLLRRGVGALTRAFAHASRRSDERFFAPPAARRPSCTGRCATPARSSSSTPAGEPRHAICWKGPRVARRERVPSLSRRARRPNLRSARRAADSPKGG